MRFTDNAQVVRRGGQVFLILTTSAQDYGEIVESLDNVKIGKDYDLQIRPKEKITTDKQRKYAWAITDDLAKTHRISREECYEMLLYRYGPAYLDEEGNRIVIKVDKSIPKEELEKKLNKEMSHGDVIAKVHLHQIGESDEYVQYVGLKGFSKMTSAELAAYIDGAKSEL